MNRPLMKRLWCLVALFSLLSANLVAAELGMDTAVSVFDTITEVDRNDEIDGL